MKILLAKKLKIIQIPFIILRFPNISKRKKFPILPDRARFLKGDNPELRA